MRHHHTNGSVNNPCVLWKFQLSEKLVLYHAKMAMEFNLNLISLSANPTKMVKHTQAKQNCLSVFDHFVKLALNGLLICQKF